jgi:hypothetical protein
MQMGSLGVARLDGVRLNSSSDCHYEMDFGLRPSHQKRSSPIMSAQGVIKAREKHFGQLKSGKSRLFPTLASLPGRDGRTQCSCIG